MNQIIGYEGQSSCLGLYNYWEELGFSPKKKWGSQDSDLRPPPPKGYKRIDNFTIPKY